jgi:hypothetical protein
MPRNPKPAQPSSADKSSSRAAAPRSKFAMLPWWMWLLIGSLLYFVLQGGHAFVDSRVAVESSWPLAIDLSSIAILVACVIAGALSLMNPGSGSSSRDPAGNAHVSAQSPRMSSRWKRFVVAVFKLQNAAAPQRTAAETCNCCAAGNVFWRIANLGAVQRLISVLCASSTAW